MAIVKPKEQSGLPEKALQQPISRGGDMPAPPERRYELRAAAMFGSELSALGEHGEVFLEATVEHHRFTTRSVTCVDGYASFLALDPDPAGQ